MLVMTFFAIFLNGKVWAQTDYSGVYYLNSRGKDGNQTVTVFEYYLCPTEGWCYYVDPDDYTGTDNGQPFITTYKCIEHANDVNPYDVRKAVWIVEKQGDFYSIKHAIDGKYLVFNGQIRTAGANRCRVHIEAMATPDDNALFTLLTKGENIVAFVPKSKSGWVLTVNQGNFDQLDGTNAKTDGPAGYPNTGGIVGIWNNLDDVNSPFYLEDAVLQPVISQASNGDITITCATNNTTIYYTLDGSTPVVPADGAPDPTGPTYKYTSTFAPALGYEGVKAVAVVSNLHAAVSKMAELSFSAYSTPTISFNGIDQVTISASHADATIYYTTDGSDPIVGTSSIYSTPLTVTVATTVKAIATHTGYLTSDMATLVISQVATPTIQNNGNNAISITSATPGATIYYTTDGSTPTTSSNLYTTPLQENVSGVTIKAIAVKENMITSEVGSGLVTLQCATPVITRVGMTFTISCSMPSDATLYYTLNGGSETEYSGPVSFTIGQLPMTVTAVARHSNYSQSETATFELINGSGTPSDPYLIYSDSDFSDFVANVNNGTTASASYKLGIDVSATGTAAITTAFTGTFDGDLYTITDLTHPLFNTVNGGTVKNVMLKNVSISGSDAPVGAIAGTANGATRIYNCGILPGSSVGSSDGYCGGLVGLLDGYARVINCFSYAIITGGSIVGGIVGYNNYASTMNDLRTMVVNCMFYGDITGGIEKYPIFGGFKINNAATTGINNYNYFYEDAPYTSAYTDFAQYNGALPASKNDLTRFEFYRSILNSNRRLCIWWINGHQYAQQTPDDLDMIAKWVLDPSIAPYPILKPWGKYPSVFNQDPNYVLDRNNEWIDRNSAPNYRGKRLGTLIVTVDAGEHKYNSAPNRTLYLPILDMDTLHHDFGYYKVQLPYYNEVFGDPETAFPVSNSASEQVKFRTRYCNNYTEKVVTGWKITSVTGGTQGSFVEDWESGYNFADRYCTDKDKYGVSGRVFAQGGYYYVPEGVSAIAIEAYWGDAIYLAQNGSYLDRVCFNGNLNGNSSMGGTAFEPAGKIRNDFNFLGLNKTKNGIYNAVRELTASDAYTVYDQAVVLISNYQLVNGTSSNFAGGKGNGDTQYSYTLMSVDLDFDNEPDYCAELQWGRRSTRVVFPPFRLDFLTVSDLGKAIRCDTRPMSTGNIRYKGHIEYTETSCIHFGEFEYDSREPTEWGKTEAPVILNGGQFDHIVSSESYIDGGRVDKTKYFIMGGNMSMKAFTPGSHGKPKTYGRIIIKTRHCAVNVMGGEFEEFYLSGKYKTNFDNVPDDPHCYTNGGKFGVMAGGGWENITQGIENKGNVTFEIDHSLIDEFYGGGCNSAKPVEGNINVTIKNSRVGKYCGGPMFGNMSEGKTITTNATNTVFGVFYGGGNGGTNFYRDEVHDNTSNTGCPTYEQWMYPGDGSLINFNFDGEYNPFHFVNTNQGYHAQFEFEFWNQVAGNEDFVAAHLIILHAQFATTRTGSITSTLTDCEVMNNFYGGGNLGAVGGSTNSLLDNTFVHGSAFGGGFSASIPSFTVFKKEGVVFPNRDAAGVCHPATWDTLGVYTWTNETEINGHSLNTGSPTAEDEDGKKYCFTEESLQDLGAVEGNATLTLQGSTTVGKSVFGGGDESTIGTSTIVGNTLVKILDRSKVLGNVYGGGNRGKIGGNTKVVINGNNN